MSDNPTVKKTHVADSPSDRALFANSAGLVCLALDAYISLVDTIVTASEEVDKQRSIMWLRQIAQFSTTISHDQRATAFHYLHIS